MIPWHMLKNNGDGTISFKSDEDYRLEKCYSKEKENKDFFLPPMTYVMAGLAIILYLCYSVGFFN